jgi:acyl-CoA thioesterase FadM
MAQSRFKSQLDASSYHAPGGGQLYKPLRDKTVQQALEQGYDEASMMEHGVSWADDQDPWGHISNAQFPHFVSACNFRLFESFEEHLGDKFQDLMKVRGIGVIVKSTILDIKRPVSYPDSVIMAPIVETKRHVVLLIFPHKIIVANRLDEVKADRYHVTTTMWSLRQQAQVAESNGWVVFFDYSKGKPANLLEAGGVYATLHAALREKCKAATQRRARWEETHPEKHGSKGSRL